MPVIFPSSVFCPYLCDAPGSMLGKHRDIFPCFPSLEKFCILMRSSPSAPSSNVTPPSLTKDLMRFIRPKQLFLKAPLRATCLTSNGRGKEKKGQEGKQHWSK